MSAQSLWPAADLAAEHGAPGWHRDDDLRSTVLALADADPTLPEDAKLAVLDALDDDGRVEPAVPGEAAQAPATAPTYLKSIRVKGFRGVGPEVQVALKPGPGLVVISGRNGSGKSTVAEALELALTGQTYRWRKPSTVWTQQWRNLHSGAEASIRLELAAQDSGPMTVGVDWAPDADLNDFSLWAQRPGEKRRQCSDPLGWAGALATYRPLLSYNELGGVLESAPSELFDKLHTLLGLERVTRAQQRLTQRQKELEEPHRALRPSTATLKESLAASDDARAQAAADLVGRRTVDIDAVEALAVGVQAPTAEPLCSLRRLAGMTVPTRGAVTDIAARLRTAATDLATGTDSVAEQSARHAALLEEALALHAGHGEQACPVCGVGTLDDDWAARTRVLLDQERTSREAVAAARAALTAARRDARSLIASVPAPLAGPDVDLPERADAVVAQELWAAAPDDDRGLADHLDAAIDAVADSYAVLRERAASLAAGYEDLWAPIAVHLAQWVGLARQVEAARGELTAVKVAVAWLKDNVVTLRDQRIAPLAERARRIWATLRQESNVDLGAIRLEGNATRRRVALLASVDGADAGALGVMSQGELHALALALFLPRATAPESPFRFIVLDDPIQAMDPSKVEGFVQVMAELAADRQVIVLSHDDRLAAAVRRSSLRASIHEVTRGTGSVVSVRETLHPAMRYLADAEALLLDDAVPAEIARRVVPGLCREALEAAAFEVYSRDAHGRGVARPVVEQEWERARTVKRRLGLALRADSDRQIMDWVRGGVARSRASHLSNSGVHGPVDGDLRDDIRAVRTAVKDLRGMSA